MRSREEKNLEGQAGAFVGNAASQNVQMGTDTAIDSMRELLYKAGKISKVGFEQSKGNLFVKWGEKEPSVEIQLHNTSGYQAWPFSVKKAFTDN